MKRILLVNLTFIALVASIIHFKDRASETEFRERGVSIAGNSFATGCVLQGRDNCFSQFKGSNNFDVIARGSCLDDLTMGCSAKTEAFIHFFTGK